MMSTCLLCDIEFVNAAEEIPYFDKISYGVCPTCRRHAEIGRRVSEMEEKDLAFVDADEVLKAERVGWNKALRVAKKGEW